MTLFVLETRLCADLEAQRLKLECLPLWHAGYSLTVKIISLWEK